MDRRSTCAQPDHCALPSAVLAAADAALAAATPQAPRHLASVLDEGETALVARLHLIRAARDTIDVQTYIWDHDDAGLLVLDELVQAAWRGVKVRILVDQLSAFGDLSLIDRLARVSPNLEVRLYNPTFDRAQISPLGWAAGIVCCFFRFNQRMHNKLLLVDDRVGITGGRNYQNRYFDWDPALDFVDRDILIGGPAARSMADSFLLFWNHPRSVPLTHLRDVNRRLRAHPDAPGWPPPRYADPSRVAQARREATDAQWIQDHILADSLRVGTAEFFSDLPGKTETPHERAALAFTRRLMQLIAGARHEVVLQTPYLVMGDRATRIFAGLRRKQPPPQIVVSTNSLASTDGFAAYALTYKHRKRYIKELGFEIYELKPHARDPWLVYQRTRMGNGTPPSQEQAPTEPAVFAHSEQGGLLGSHGGRPVPLESGGLRFSLHAKSLVVDSSFAMIGSHNFDPRSDHYNTEAGVIVYDHRLAARLRGAILRDVRPENAWVVAPREPVPVLTDISQAIGDVSPSLPLFDFWPFRYATDFELKDGCAPMRPSNPAFYSCYRPVGDFPDVAMTPKAIYTRLITAFGLGVQGIL